MDHLLGELDKEVKEVKYRRMRDLNNEASKRCRQKRKMKFQEMEEYEEELRSKNQELRIRCQNLEDLVEKMKKAYIKNIAGARKNDPKTPLDLNALLGI